MKSVQRSDKKRRIEVGKEEKCKKAFALHEVTSETESRARLVKNEACDPKHLGDFRPALAIVRW